MRDWRIEFTQFEFVTIHSLTISRRVNEHACAVVCGYVSDEKAKEYQKRLLQDVWMQITAIDESGQSAVLITGIVADFTLESTPHLKQLTLRIVSGTWLMDGYPHFRTFQNQSFTYIDVMETINKGYEDAGVIGIKPAYSSIGDLLVQYKETDWTFIKRISSQFGTGITPATGVYGVKYYIGRCSGKEHKAASQTPYTVSKAVGTFMQCSASGIGSLYEEDYLEYKFSSREIYDLWDQVTLNRYTGYISSIDSKYDGKELNHTYSLRSMAGMGCIPLFNQQQTGCSFEAIVKEVKQDVVRIEVIGDEHPEQIDTKWFSYSTVYSTPDGPGWYCMPEAGDHVRLHIPGEREGDGYVISAVHKGNSPDRQNPDHKSIKTIHGKELLMTPDTMVFTNNKGMRIEILDQEGIRIISDKDILIQSTQNVTVSSEEASLMIAGTSSVDVTQNGASIKLEDDVTFTGAKFRIH